jgi:hypothetical protein
MLEKDIFNQTNDLIKSVSPMKIVPSEENRIDRVLSQLEIRRQQILEVNKIEKDSPFYEWVEGIYNDAIQIVKMTV